jgi:hypothetical protein
VGFPVNGEEELIFIAQVSDENQISTVQAHSEELGIDETLVPVPVGTEMYFERPPSEEFIHLPPEYSYTTEIRQYLKSIQSQTSGTLYVSQGTVEADYAAGYDGIENTSVTVTAVDAYGNVGQVSQEVDPADRTGSVEIVESDLKASDDDDAGQITVDTTYNTGGVADAQVIVKNAQTGQVVAKGIDPSEDGESHLDVNMTRVDNGDKLNAYLVDASETGEYVVDSDTNDDDAQTVSGLTDLAYTVNDDGTIADSWDTTGDSTLQTAVDEMSAETLYVEKGTYDPIKISQSVTLEAAPGVSADQVTIEGDASINSKGAVVIPAGVNDVTIDGVTLKQSDADNSFKVDAGNANDIGDQNQNLNVKNSDLVTSDIAVFATSIKDSTFHNNDFIVADDETAREIVFIGGESTYSAGRASENVNLTENTFVGTVDRDQPSRADGNAIEFEATGDSEIRDNNFTDVTFPDSNAGVKIVYTSSDVTVENNEGIEASEIKQTDQVAPSIASETKSTSDGTTTVTVTVSDDDSKSATFDSGLDASTVKSTDFDVTDGSSSVVASDGVSVDPVSDGDQSVTVTITLDGDYSDTTINAEITGEISDLAGNTAPAEM